MTGKSQVREGTSCNYALLMGRSHRHRIFVMITILIVLICAWSYLILALIHVFNRLILLIYCSGSFYLSTPFRKMPIHAFCNYIIVLFLICCFIYPFYIEL